MSHRSGTSLVQMESEPGSQDLYEEDIEVARDRTDAELKSDEILCNYGDNVVLDDVSEDALNSGTPKPVSERFLSKVRYFVRNRITSKQVAFDISLSGSQQSETASDSIDSEDSHFSSLGPSKSYSSLTDYLNSLAEKKLSIGRSGAKSTHLHLDTNSDDKATLDKFAVGEHSTEPQREE